jgi:hypothetical protein
VVPRAKGAAIVDKLFGEQGGKEFSIEAHFSALLIIVR